MNNFNNTDQKEFICDICPTKESFNKKSHLKDHMNLKHISVGQRKCVKCSNKYSQMCNFVVHFKKNHLKCSKPEKCTSKNPCKVCENYLQQMKIKWVESKLLPRLPNEKKVLYPNERFRNVHSGSLCFCFLIH